MPHNADQRSYNGLRPVIVSSILSLYRSPRGLRAYRKLRVYVLHSVMHMHVARSASPQALVHTRVHKIGRYRCGPVCTVKARARGEAVSSGAKNRLGQRHETN